MSLAVLPIDLYPVIKIMLTYALAVGKSLAIKKHSKDFSKEILLLPIHCISGFEGGIIFWERTFTRVNAALSTSASVVGWHAEKLENQFCSWHISPVDILVAFVSESHLFLFL